MTNLMKNDRGYYILTLIFVGVVIFSISCRNRSTEFPIRVGWQTAWATQGQVVEALKHSEILKRNGIAATFNEFSSGPPAIESALAGNLDVVSGVSQPLLLLLGKSTNLIVV